MEKVNNNKRKNIKELFKDYKGDYTPSEFDWGEPKGKEINVVYSEIEPIT